MWLVFLDWEDLRHFQGIPWCLTQVSSAPHNLLGWTHRFPWKYQVRIHHSHIQQHLKTCFQYHRFWGLVVWENHQNFQMIQQIHSQLRHSLQCLHGFLTCCPLCHLMLRTLCHRLLSLRFWGYLHHFGWLCQHRQCLSHLHVVLVDLCSFLKMGWERHLVHIWCHRLLSPLGSDSHHFWYKCQGQIEVVLPEKQTHLHMAQRRRLNLFQCGPPQCQRKPQCHHFHFHFQNDPQWFDPNGSSRRE